MRKGVVSLLHHIWHFAQREIIASPDLLLEHVFFLGYDPFFSETIFSRHNRV